MFSIVKKATQMAQNLIEMKINKNESVIDATLGNGNDTLFLSSLVPDGKVYSFDVQYEVLEKFKVCIREKNINNVILINDGHEKMDKYIKEKVRAIMFNLGYLPGGDRNIVTKTETTLQAINKGLELLLPGGLITIISYTGHTEGKKEKEGIIEFLKSLSSREYSVMEISFINRNNNPPCLIVIEKNDNLHVYK